MESIQVVIRTIGNSKGIVLPKTVLAQTGLDLEETAEMTIEDGAIVLRKAAAAPRTNWAEAAKKIAALKEDELLLGEFGNQEDADLRW